MMTMKKLINDYKAYKITRKQFEKAVSKITGNKTVNQLVDEHNKTGKFKAIEKDSFGNGRFKTTYAIKMLALERLYA